MRKVSGNPSGEQSGNDNAAGRAAVYVSEQQGVSKTVAGDRDGDGEDVCGNAGSNRLANR